MNENNKYHRYAIKHELKGKQIPLNVPKLCPLCASLEIAGTQKFRDSTSGRKYIYVPLCSKHYHLNRNQLLKVFGIILLIIILNVIIVSVTTNRDILFISSILSILFCTLYILKFMSNVMKNKNIREYLDIKYTKNIITVLIKNSGWAEAFKELNHCEHYDLYGDLNEELDSKSVKLITILLLWIIFSIFSLIVSQTIIRQGWLKFFFDVLVVLGFVIIILLLLYYLIKKERKKTIRDTS